MTEQKADLEAFAAKLESLEIEVSRDEEGLLTVCSQSEPLFCYDAHDEEAINALVVDTLQSYGRHFFGLEHPSVVAKHSPVGKAGVPVNRVHKVSKIEPTLNEAA
ncbi:MAG: hypothetical protein WA957_08715 [Alteraurantiacibacter sp.]